MAFTVFLTFILSDLLNFILSVSRQKHICEVKKYSHVDIKLTTALTALKMF